MSREIVTEFYFWGFCFLAGAFLTLVYDVILIIRKVSGSGQVAETVEDLLFWMFAALFLFGLLYKLNSGVVRWFAILGFFIGMLVYKNIIKDHFVNVMSTIIEYILHMVARVVRPPLILVKTVVLRVFYRLKGNLCSQKKKLTCHGKKGNMNLCKHLRRQMCITEKENVDEPYEKEKKEDGQSRIPDGCTSSRNDAGDDFCKEYSAKQ